MKRNYFLLFAAAAFSLTFAACSKDVVDSVDVITPDMATSYAKVTISMPAVAGTRAEGDPQWGGFENGTSGEETIKSVALVLYDAAGTPVGTGAPTEDLTFADDNTKNVENTKNLVFKLTLNEGADTPKSVVAFINTPAVSFPLTDLTAELNQVANYKNTQEGNLKDTFVMTNAGYYNGETYVLATALTDDSIYANASAAAEGTLAATIYVERLAAKITVTDGASNKTADINIKDVAGEAVTATFDFGNWVVSGVPAKMHLLKNEFTYTAATDSWMNESNYFRSYWANGVNYGAAYNAYYNEEGYTGLLAHKSLADVKASTTKVSTTASSNYTLEHTYDYSTLAEAPGFNAIVPSTSALLVGNYTLSGTNAEWFKIEEDEASYDGEYDFYLIYTGADANGKANYTIYNKSQFIGYLMYHSGVKEVAETSEAAEGFSTLLEDNSKDLTEYFDVVKEDGKFKIAALAEGAKTLYKKASAEAESFDTAVSADELEYASNARHYVEGLSYFYVPVEHYAAVGDATGKYGVVRNHSYKMTINSVTGLGAPLDEDNTGDNEGEDIDPDPTVMKDAYINATINVLSWHTTDQAVNL